MTYTRLSAVGLVAFAGMIVSANAQTALSGCNATTGLGANGQPCVELAPLDPNRISNVSPGAIGGEQFRSLDVTTLGQTYECRELDGSGRGPQQGTLLIEDCGAPLTLAELGQLQPFYGTTGPVAQPPSFVYAPPAPPSPPIAVAPTPPPTPVATQVAAAAPTGPVPGAGTGAVIAADPTGFVPLIGAAAPFLASAAAASGVAAAAAAAGGSSTPSTQ